MSDDVPWDDVPRLDRSAPTPGPPGEPASPPGRLLADFVRGEGAAGAAGEWRVEGALLEGRETPLAIRLDGAVLLRCELPDDVGDLRAALEEVLAQASMRCVEERAVLGHVIGIEVAALRHGEWDLWADEPERGHAALRARALGDMAERIDPDEPARREREAQVLDQLERRLWS